MKLSILTTLLSVSLILILSGCGLKPKPKEEAVIDATLPKIKLTEHGIIKGMKSIALEWETIKDKRVKGIYLFKVALDENKTAGIQVDDYLDTIDNRFSSHYLDTDIKPNSRYSYYFKTYSKDAESVNSETTVVTSNPIIKSVTWIHASQDMPRSAKIIWRPHTNNLVNGYEIQRRTFEDKEWKSIVSLDGRLRAEYIDNELQDKHTYIYRIRALTYNKIVSSPSKEVTVTTKALPTEVTNIKATDNKPRMIVVTWDKTDIQDFLKYNVYRSKSVDGGYQLIAEISKNSYTDAIPEDGVKYFYKISTVDKDSLESSYEVNSAQGVTLVKPKTPVIVQAKIVEGVVVLKWDKTDDRTATYIVSKRYQKGMFDEVVEDIEGITNTTFEDAKLEPATVYYYKVYSVDKNDIRSNESIEVELETNKAEEI